MATEYVSGVWRESVQATKPTAGTQVSPIVMLPEGLTDFTVYAKGSAAAACKIWQSASSAEQILTGTGVEWISLHASLDAVGATTTVYPLGSLTPVALKVESLTNDETATMTVTAKYIA